MGIKQIVAIGVLVALAGCASSPERLARASAISIGGNIPPDRITIADIDRGMTDVSWTARTGRSTYHCSADDMVRQLLCIKQ